MMSQGPAKVLSSLMSVEMMETFAMRGEVILLGALGIVLNP